MPLPTALASLDEVKARLNLPSGDADDDAELQSFLDSATQVLQNLYGDVIPTQYTERLRPYGDGTRFLLGRSPILTVDGITVRWSYLNSPTLTLNAQMYRPNLVTGEIEIYAMSPAFSWQYAARDWSMAEFDVTYTAGRATVTPAVKDAVLEILRINWQPQQAGNLPGIGSNEETDQGFDYQGFFIPNSANERLQGGMRPRQIA